MPKPILTQSHIISLFYYLDGHLYWKKRPCTTSGNHHFNSRYAGKKAGSVNDSGYIYISITINSKTWHYKAHRLIYKIFTGIEPAEIDHIDHNRINNPIGNLRNVEPGGNSKNCTLSSFNSSGFTGVGWHKHAKKWVARITHNYKSIHLGCFISKQDAIEARQAANIKYGFHENHGKL